MTAFGELLAAWVLRDFGLAAHSVEEVNHGADDAAQLWRVVSDVGAAYAVKLSGGGTAAGLVVSMQLANGGVDGIPSPILTRDERLFSERDGRRLSVVPWVSNHRALDGGMHAGHWAAFGSVLAQVHAAEVTDELIRILPREDHTHEGPALAVVDLNRRLGVAETDRTEVGVPDDELADELMYRWRVASGRVSTLVTRADRLGQELRRSTARPVVCHGDPHLGNLLLDAPKRVWLIDWDDVVLAPRERDLMFVVDGVLAFAPVTAQERAWFFDGYGAVDLDARRLAYYQCVRALLDLVDPAAAVIDGRRPRSERVDALEIVEGVLSPTGLVDIALRHSG